MNTENGWTKIRNDIHDDPLLNKDSEYLSVWIYLLTHQAYGEYKAIFSGKVITLKEGQLLTSRAKIASATGVSDSKIKRILKSLKSDQRIDQQTDMQQSLITLISLDSFDQRNDRQTDQRLTNDRPTKQETENEKEKRSKREKDKEKEINKNERMEEIYNPSISPQGETGREDFPLTEKDLDKWLEEDDGIDDWDKFQIFYKNLNNGQMSAVGGQQDCYTGNNETNGFNNTNPIQQENKECINPHPPTPFSLAKQITQNACISSMQGIAYHHPKGAYHQPTGCMSFAEGESGFGHAPVPRIEGEIPSVNEVNPCPLSPASKASPSDLFDEFWQEYPKKIGKGYAFECFKKTKPTRKLVDIMLEAIKKQKKSDMWKRDKGQYIPNPSTWLNQKRWEDDLGGDTDENPWSSFKLGIEL